MGMSHEKTIIRGNEMDEQKWIVMDYQDWGYLVTNGVIYFEAYSLKSAKWLAKVLNSQQLPPLEEEKDAADVSG